jgi:hypothetical protein
VGGVASTPLNPRGSAQLRAEGIAQSGYFGRTFVHDYPGPLFVKAKTMRRRQVAQDLFEGFRVRGMRCHDNGNRDDIAQIRLGPSSLL